MKLSRFSDIGLRALMYLGLNTVKSLVLGFSLVETTKVFQNGFDIEAHWRRAIIGATDWAFHWLHQLPKDRVAGAADSAWEIILHGLAAGPGWASFATGAWGSWSASYTAFGLAKKLRLLLIGE